MLFFGGEELSKEIEHDPKNNDIVTGEDIKITVQTLIKAFENKDIVSKNDVENIRNIYQQTSLDYKYTEECKRIANDLMKKYDEDRLKDLMGAIEENNHQLYYDIINIILFLLDETSTAKFNKFADNVIEIFKSRTKENSIKNNEQEKLNNDWNE